MAASLIFSAWFFFAVYEQRNQGVSIDPNGNSAETSKRLRTEVRSWLRQTFPDSAARADTRFGFFELERKEQPMLRNDWVVLVHGLDEPGDIWTDLAPQVADMGFRVLEFRYPNDQPVHESSRFLHLELDALVQSDSSVEGLHLIGHSMGGLVLREFITHPELMAQASWIDTVTVKTLIQLGTPNHGSWLATYRMPVELRDHLHKDYGPEAFLGMIWDGAGEAQIDIKPGSVFLESLNQRSFPPAIYWVGIAGTGSPVDLLSVQAWSRLENTQLADSIGKLRDTFPELFKGTGDGVVSVESVRCDEMNEVHQVDAHHRNMVRDPDSDNPPAIPIVLKELARSVAEL